MRPYRKLIPGAPYTKEPYLTKGFEEGVGYAKNFFKHNPVVVMYMGLFGIAAVGIAYRTYNMYNTDPDELYKYKRRYTVYRKEDIAHPDKDCYN